MAISALGLTALLSVILPQSSGAPPPPPVTPAQSEPEASGDDIVVVGRRRPKPLDSATPTGALSEGQIATYGARSVGDLIRQLQAEQGGRPFSIVVNGRRVSSLADINELPAEALASLQLYAPAEGKRFGYAPTERLLNITLKQHFRTLALDVEGSGPTDGGARSVKDSVRGARIQGDSRVNGAINVRAGTALLASQRPRLPDDPPDAEGQSLVPRTRALDGTFGVSQPLGTGTLDLNLSGNLSRSFRQRAGAFGQTDDAGTASLSTAYNLNTAGLFAFLSASLDASNGRSRITGRCAATGGRACPLQDLDTETLGATLSGTVSGKVATIPTGDLRLDMTLQRNATRTAVRDRLADSSVRRTDYAGTSGRVNLSIPLVSPQSWLGFLGTVQIAPALDYNAVDGVGGVLGTNLSANWELSRAVAINASISRRAVLPSNEQLNAPERTLVGVTVYDYRAAALVPVEQVVGGAPLARQSVDDVQVAASYNGTLGKTQLFANLNYARSTIERPPFAITEPSRFFERLFPDRFVRDAAGTLLRVDARPFNAVRQANAFVTGSFNLSGSWGGTTTGPRQAGAINWTVSVSGQRQLEQSLLLAPGIAAIDMLTTPLSLSIAACADPSNGMETCASPAGGLAARCPPTGMRGSAPPPSAIPPAASASPR